MKFKTPQKPRSNTKRRFLQFSLRAVLVLITIFAMWLGYVCKLARDQKTAVDRVYELRGWVYYEHEYHKGRHVKGAKPPGPTWLRKIIGNEFFQDVTRVGLSKTDVTDADLRLVGRLTSLHSLDLSETVISDAGLVHIADLRELSELSLANTKVTGSGLQYLQNLRNLNSLNLPYTRVDDDRLKHLTVLPKLGDLSIGGTSVTSEGIKHLESLRALQSLSLQDTNVDDLAIPALTRMKGLTLLVLDSTQISGKGLFELRSTRPECEIWGPLVDLRNLRLGRAGGIAQLNQVVKRMQSLHEEGHPMKLIDLAHSDILDEHLLALHNLEGVQAIDLRGTHVTDDGLDQLRKALPQCEIIHESNGR